MSCLGAPSFTTVYQSREHPSSPLPCPAQTASVLLMLFHLAAGKCQKPQWDPRILFVPDKESYDLNETVILTCPVGYWLSHTEVSCMKQNPRQGSTASQSIWHEKNGRGRWQPVERNMICVGE